MKVKFHCPKTGIPDALLSGAVQEINSIAAEHGLHVGTLKMSVELRDSDGYARHITCEVPDPNWEGRTTEADVGYLIHTEPYKRPPKEKPLVKVFADENGEVIGYMYQTTEIQR